MNLASILKMLGVKVAPEHIKAAEDIIPKLPGLVNQAVTSINGAMQGFDGRLRAIETRLNAIQFGLERIEGNGQQFGNHSDGGDTYPAGSGGTQRALERGNLNGAD